VGLMRGQSKLISPCHDIEDGLLTLKTSLIGGEIHILDSPATLFVT